MADDEPDAPDTGDKDEILEEALEAFKLCEEREADNRVAALDDLKFGLLDEQWPDTIRKAREDQGRPVLTTNLLRPIMKQVMNEARQNRPQITVHPADSKADVHTAQVLNGLIRNIEATSKADQAYDTALESAVAGGWGYVRVNTYYAQDDAFDLDICIDAVPNPFTVWGDPYSAKPDSSDWNTCFVGETIPKDQFELKYKGAKAVDWKGGEYASLGGVWLSEEKVFVVEYWTREEVPRKILLLSDGSIVGEDVWKEQQATLAPLGLTVIKSRVTPSHKVRQRLMTGAEVLEERSWAGRYIPVVPIFGEVVNVEGDIHWRSLIRSAKGAQQKYNVWDSAATELAALAPKIGWVGAKGSFDTDAAKWASSNTESWPYIEYDVVAGQPPPTRPQVDFAGAAAALQQALAAANDIKAITGVHEPGLGAPLDAEASGRALLQMQQRSDTSTFNFTDNQARGIEHVGRIVLDLIPHVYSGERIVRVLGPGGERLPPVQLGKPTQMMDAKGKPLANDQGPVIGIYDVAAGKYDLDVKVGPSFATQRQEAAAQIMRLIEVMPAAAPVLADIMAKMLDWPESDEIATRLQALLPDAAKGQNPQLQAALQAMAQGKAAFEAQIAELENKLQQAGLAVEDMQVKQDNKDGELAIKRRQLEIDAYRAETERGKMLAPKGYVLDPNQVAIAVTHALTQLATGPDISTDGGPAAVGLDGQPLIPPGAMPMQPPAAMLPPMNGGAPPFGA
jgi:hypothetical protein